MLVLIPSPEPAAMPAAFSAPPGSIHVSIAGPALTRPLARYLSGDTDRLPKGEGGASSVVWQLAVDLLERESRVSVVTLDQTTPTPVLARGRLLDVTYEPQRAHHSMRDLLRVERRAIESGLRRANGELVHAHWCGEYALAALATETPTLVSVHDWMPAILRFTDISVWPHWSGRMLIYFLVLLRARHLTANSPYTARQVRRVTRGAVEVVPNGVADVEFLTAPEQVGSTDPESAPPAILSVNNGFGPRKNVRNLLLAFAALMQRWPQVRLRLAGVGYEPGGVCEHWARRHRMAEGVEFLGVLSRRQVLAEMRRATVLVHPSKEEAFGMTLIEAMSQRLPVIGGKDSGAVPWVLDGGKAGLLVDVRDVRALARAMEALHAGPELRARLAEGGYARARAEFRQSRVTDLFLAAYRRVLEETTPTGLSRESSRIH